MTNRQRVWFPWVIAALVVTGIASGGSPVATAAGGHLADGWPEAPRLAPAAVICPAATATFTGAGTALDPYIVTNSAQLQAIEGNDRSAHYRQDADIDMSCATDPYVPIGYNQVFTGVYDGNGKRISNFIANDPNAAYIGVFAETSGATIEDLTLADFDIGGSSYIGALAGKIRASTVSGITVVDSTISAEYSTVGGVIGGAFSSSIADVTVTDTIVSGPGNVGGVIGYSQADTAGYPMHIVRTWSSATVSATPESQSDYGVGGLIGYAAADGADYVVSESASTGTVTSNLDYIGGLIGYSWIAAGSRLIVESSANTGDVSGFRYTGGLIGSSAVDGALRITDSYSTGDVFSDPESAGEVGGLIGSLSVYANGSNGVAVIESSYSAGAVSGPTPIGAMVGLFDGNGPVTVSSVFWDSDTNGLATDSLNDTDGLPTSAMQSLDTFTTATPEWSIEAWPTSGAAVWGHCDGEYPFLVWDVRNVPASCAIASATLPPPPPQSGRSVERIAGADRYGTAVELSRRFHSTASTVYLVSGHDHPDAVVAGPAAAADGAPVLLTARDAIPAATMLELQRLGATRVVIVGGTDAIGSAVEQSLRDIGLTVTRIAGADRYSTAAALARITHSDRAATVYVATGTSFPDALAATPAAVAAGAPILLTRPDVVPEATTAELSRLAPSRIVLIGGATAVSTAVEAQLAAVAPVTRVSGADRYATATEVSRRSFPSGASTVFLATGLTHPDALVGAAYAARIGAPVLLTRGDCLPPAVVSELARLQPTRVMLLGRSASLDGDVSGPTC